MNQQFYTGVIEDVNDPMKLGRCRVRVFGLHTDDKNLIPTEALPWAQTMQPTTSASISGVGTSATGLLPGSWVVLFFHDSDKQYPVIMGSFHGFPVDNTTQTTSLSELEFSDNEAKSNIVTDSNGTPVVSGNGTPVQTGEPPVPEEEKKIPGKVDPAKLGSVSARFESNGNPGTINNYKTRADSGGASYGSYQFASFAIGPNQPATNRTIQNIKNSALVAYLRRSRYSSEFAGLQPATNEFDSKWKEIARRDPSGFLADQHKEIERSFYQTALNKLPSSITNRGLAIHEAIWSRSVQLGPSGAANLIRSIGTIDSQVCDSKVVELIYDQQIKNVPTTFASSPKLWSGLRSRFQTEKNLLINLARTYEGECQDQVKIVETPKVEYNEDGKDRTTEQKVVRDPATIPPNQRKLGERGFTDPNKKFPLYFNEADTYRLSRGIVTGTPIEKKRLSVVTARPSGNLNISEPTTQYNTQYPKNKVFYTETGHLIEIDDTEGYERIHVYHKSGSFVEFHPDGKIVSKSVGSNHLIVSDNNEIIVLGSNNSSIEGSENKSVNGDKETIIGGSENKTVNGSLNIRIEGDVNISSGGSMTFESAGTMTFNAPRYDHK